MKVVGTQTGKTCGTSHLREQSVAYRGFDINRGYDSHRLNRSNDFLDKNRPKPKNDQFQNQAQSSLDSKDSLGQEQKGSDRDLSRSRTFERRKQVTCYACHKPRHIPAECSKAKVAFSYVKEVDENLDLLHLYMLHVHIVRLTMMMMRHLSHTY